MCYTVTASKYFPYDKRLSRDRAGRKHRAVKGQGRVEGQGQTLHKTMSSAARDSRCPRCNVVNGTQLYAAAAAAATTTTPTSTAGSGGLLMDVETTVQFLSTASPRCCRAATFGDIPRPSNDHRCDLERPSDDLLTLTLNDLQLTLTQRH